MKTGDAPKLVDEQLAVPTSIHGRTFHISAFRFEHDGRRAEHVAVQLGTSANQANLPVLIRIHSACIAGDVFGTDECDCAQQLAYAFERILAEGSGVIVYLTDQDGRGSGTVAKLRTAVAVSPSLNLPPDTRSYSLAAAILRRLGVERVRLLSANEAKAMALREAGVEVAAVLPCPPLRTTDRIESYLRTRGPSGTDGPR